MKAIIVDDEKHSREILKNLLLMNCPECTVCDSVDSVESAIIAIKKFKPDIVFLDIELGNDNGFEVLEYFDVIDFKVIFVTAYNFYAIKAIKFSALDYLLKPIDSNDLLQALKKAKRELNETDGTINNHINLLKKQSSIEKPDRIALPTDHGFVFTKIEDIIRCEAESNYTRFYFVNKKNSLICHTLKEYEDLLSDYDFCRIHHSHLINLHHVVSFTKGKGGYVTMSDGNSVEVSIRKRDAFLQSFTKI